MKKILFALLSGSAAFAFASDADLYVGIGGGAAWVSGFSSAQAMARIDGGYNFNQYFALELGFTGVAQNQGNGTINSMTTNSYNNVNYLDLSVKGTLPLGDLFALYGKVGGAYARATGYQQTSNLAMYSVANDTDAYQLMLEGGLQLNVTRHFGITLSDLGYLGSSSAFGSTNTVELGLLYNF